MIHIGINSEVGDAEELMEMEPQESEQDQSSSFFSSQAPSEVSSESFHKQGSVRCPILCVIACLQLKHP